MLSDSLHISAKQISQLMSVEPHSFSFDSYFQSCYLIRLVNYNFSICLSTFLKGLTIFWTL